MKIYYEAIEKVKDPVEGEFVRLDVTDNTESERLDIFTGLKDVMSGIDCIFQKHTCYHEELNKSCEIEKDI